MSSENGLEISISTRINLNAYDSVRFYLMEIMFSLMLMSLVKASLYIACRKANKAFSKLFRLGEQGSLNRMYKNV